MDTKCPNTSDTSKQSTRIEKIYWVLPLIAKESIRWALNCYVSQSVVPPLKNKFISSLKDN